MVKKEFKYFIGYKDDSEKKYVMFLKKVETNILKSFQKDLNILSKTKKWPGILLKTLKFLLMI